MDAHAHHDDTSGIQDPMAETPLTLWPNGGIWGVETPSFVDQMDEGLARAGSMVSKG